ncbi:MAG: VIT and VWA domain-containing protein [Gemmatales bacterium]|nr:VIT and VWA domain-containing protein [Gemmatales bacterium]MDW8222177.1 VIT domain-containing protein [Gemmatales bacterium]
MRRIVGLLAGLLVLSQLAHARGLIIPREPTIPPLALVQHEVNVRIDDQIAHTRVMQVFRNHTDRQLEATYVFPVPKGASVREFTMWVDGKPVKAELLEADKAREIYLSIVRRYQDPGLLEYLGHDLFQARIFPVPPRGDQKIEIGFASVCARENNAVEYVYPLKTDGKALQTLEKFSFRAQIQSQHPILNIYSPTHGITVSRKGERDATVSFEKDKAVLDRNFVLYYTLGGEQVGLTALAHRPNRDQDGYVCLLLAPRYEVSPSQRVPRDIVFVLDTSGSMTGKKIEQAKQALTMCLDNLPESDRFALLHFATTVTKYPGGMQAAHKDNIEAAKKWVRQLPATGGTAIQDALLTALQMRTQDQGRIFIVVFITDGQPTVGETNIDRILANVARHNQANTRIFSIGIGHDLNASLLDQLADQSKAFSTFIVQDDEIVEKMNAFQERISRPVLANIQLEIEGSANLYEMYPPHLPDLYHNAQLVVFARYRGAGPVKIRLKGRLGQEAREFVYDTELPAQNDGREFVEELWARRKVGYLLEQIRLNGESEELRKEVIELAKKYSIATPYTSYLVVPDEPLPPVVRPGPVPRPVPEPALLRQAGQKEALPVVEALKQQMTSTSGQLGEARAQLQMRLLQESERELRRAVEAGTIPRAAADRWLEQNLKTQTTQTANAAAGGQLARGGRQAHRELQVSQLGVNLSQYFNELKSQTQLTGKAQQQVLNRNLLELGGVWVDEGFTPQTRTQVVKAFSPAYFRILERYPELKDVFKMGTYVVWITPSGVALVIDGNHGAENLTDAEIDALMSNNGPKPSGS